MKIYITGDTHADFVRFGSQYFDDKECYVILCGDFGGIWDGSNQEKYWLDWLENKKFTVLFVDGNHENFDMLNSFPVEEWNGGRVHMIRKNIIHLMRGQVFTIEGTRFFTFGGGRSHDIDAGILDRNDPDFAVKKRKLDRERALYRINHESWWKEELPSEDEMAEGLENLQKVGELYPKFCVNISSWHNAYLVSGRLCRPLYQHTSGNRDACQGRRLAAFHFTLDARHGFCYSGMRSPKKIDSCE